MVMIISTRSFRGDEGFIKPRTRMDVTEKRAQQLVGKGLATYELGAKMDAAPKNKMAGAAPATKEALPAGGSADPTPAPQAGSQTGEGKPARSSSRRARRQKK